MPETYVGTSGAAGSAGIWTIIVTIAGVDVTARIVGDIRIDAEEDSARVADLTIAPASTSFAAGVQVTPSNDRATYPSLPTAHTTLPST